MDPRDQTFMTIHNLTPDANILFASDSILDILGYTPDEVKGKSCFEYFHPEEVPFARSIHSRGVLMDKAAVLHYARILSKRGQYVNCECCFTVVHNVLVASTSIYFKGEKSDRRAREAPHIRRMFSSSPLDPRYHMLEHLSPKFRMPAMEREPRAALILNRFSRNLNIMYATDAVNQILGLRPDELLEKPFYDCIQTEGVEEAERCLESAKANESIAYLRFWYKDPRIDNVDGEEDEDDDDGGGGDLDDGAAGSSDLDVKCERGDSSMDVDDDDVSIIEIKEEDDGRACVERRNGSLNPFATPPAIRSARTFELEAVVSCTSDGLVVVLRKARPAIPDLQPVVPAAFNYHQNGLFAAPWGLQPIEPYIPPDLLYTFRPPFLPQYMPLRENVKAAGGPPLDQLMRSIRDVAVFAWALSGINGNLANYGHGMPRRGAQPADGLPVWDLNSGSVAYQGRADEAIPTKENPKTAYGHHLVPSGAPMQGYARTRHSSLDEGMYDDYQGNAPWPPPPATPYRYSGCEAGQHQSSPPPPHLPLRSISSYNGLHDHAQRQQGYFPPSPATSRWGEGSSSRTCAPGYGTSSSRPSDPGESPGNARYFWQQ